jgi:DNA-binding NarL/FixJ family response regulator
MNIIRVLIVDDHLVVRRGLQSLLSSYRDVQVVGEAADGESAKQAVVNLSPDVILMDVRLPGQDGIEVVRQLSQTAPEAKVIILTAFDNDEYVLSALKAGAYAYLLKSSADETLAESIRLVAQGKRLLSPPLMDSVLKEFQSMVRTHAQRELGLSEEDITILKLIADGATNMEVAEHMHWSERTVGRKVEEIMAKIGAKNRTHAVAMALKEGLI